MVPAAASPVTPPRRDPSDEPCLNASGQPLGIGRHCSTHWSWLCGIPSGDPLDVSADELRRRIRLTLSVLGHTDNAEQAALLARLLRGEAGI